MNLQREDVPLFLCPIVLYSFFFDSFVHLTFMRHHNMCDVFQELWLLRKWGRGIEEGSVNTGTHLFCIRLKHQPSDHETRLEGVKVESFSAFFPHLTLSAVRTLYPGLPYEAVFSCILAFYCSHALVLALNLVPLVPGSGHNPLIILIFHPFHSPS